MSDVAITAPDPTTGRMMPATVPEADLEAALAAGAERAKPQGQYEKELGGTLGQAASFAFGAGRTASGGASDGLLIEGANIFGGESARADMLQGLNAAKDTNPYSNLGGEAAGLFVGAGKGLTAVGAGVESAAASRVGAGLLGKVAGMGARGLVEGAALGAQHQITEDTLGDVDYNGEKIFATAAKDSLLGGGIGAGLGVVGHYGGEALTALRANRGPVPAGLLDDVAGVEGAGTALRQDVRATEGLVNDFQKAGATSEQGAVMADEINQLAKAKSSAGPLSGLIDDRAAQLAKARSGGNADLEDVFLKGYGDRAQRIIGHDAEVGTQALAVTKHGTELMRAEETLNRINFTERPDQFAKLLDPTKIDAAADAAALMAQKVDATVSKFEQVAMQGGEAVQVKALRKTLNSLYSDRATLVDAATGAARENALRDMYMGTYRLKQAVQDMAGFGKALHMRTASEGMFGKLAEDLRTGLEDESVWGRAGAANREWNETFSGQLARRNDFANRFGVSIDQAAGVPRPEVDFEKTRNFLKSISGNAAEDDALQGMKSAGSFTDGIRSRLGALEKYADMTPADRAVFEKARASADAFDATFATARKESAVVSRLRTQALEEQGHSLGGVLGLATDIMTKPLQTMERLGALKAATERFEKGIANGISRFFKGESVAADGVMSASRGAARSKDVVANEIGELRELVANQPAMQSRVGKLLGDVSSYAPKIGGSASGVALRALTFLATEAPTPRADVTMLGTKPALRFSDQQLSVYENKRNAAFHPETVVQELNLGKLNRDGIRTVKAVYPRMFAQMQDTARTQLMEMDQKGLLDKMPYQQKAAIASLLEVAPDGTWKPDFMALMQSTKLPGGPGAGAPPKSGPGGVSARPIRINTAVMETEAQQIEGRTT